MTLIFMGLLVILMVLVVKSSLSQTGLWLKVAIHILGGVVGLWLVDLMLSVVGLSVPINVFTILVVGLLGFPGVGMLTLMQVIGL